jgi:hypothetical protein
MNLTRRSKPEITEEKLLYPSPDPLLIYNGMTTSYAGGAKQGNFKSIKFDGLLVDRNNIVKLFARGSQLYLRTKHSSDLVVTDYDNHDDAVEDMQLYERVLANPDAKVINIRNDGRFQAYGIGSDEYRELMCGLPITLDTSGDEIVS